jgi:hypothetical protein
MFCKLQNLLRVDHSEHTEMPRNQIRLPAVFGMLCGKGIRMRVFLYWKAGCDSHECSQRNQDLLSAL